VTERLLFKRNFNASIVNLNTGSTIDVLDLRIAFKITKTNSDKGSKALVEIYNLSPLNREKVLSPNTKTGSPQVEVSLYGGYGTDSKLLFKGVGTAASEWSPPDYVTKFTVTDAVAVSSDPFSKEYPKQTSIDVIIDDLLKNIKLPRGVIQKVGFSIPTSRSFSGQPETILSGLASNWGFVFDIQNGFVNIYFGNTAPRKLVTLSKDTGLVAKPYWEGSIVKARSLVIPEIVPNGLVELDIRNVSLKGRYTVAKVVAKGDNWKASTYMDLELEPRGLEPIYQTLTGVEGIIA
jgi:hypothetical protein